MNGRLAQIATAYASIATDNSVPFVNLYDAYLDDELWEDDPDKPDPLFFDGIHPRIDTGDDLNARLISEQIQGIIPEPSTALLLGSGLLVLAHRQRRKAA
jgi:lysophospholipase L1-like esterase